MNKQTKVTLLALLFMAPQPPLLIAFDIPPGGPLVIPGPGGGPYTGPGGGAYTGPGGGAYTGLARALTPSGVLTTAPAAASTPANWRRRSHRPGGGAYTGPGGGAYTGLGQRSLFWPRRRGYRPLEPPIPILQLI